MDSSLTGMISPILKNGSPERINESIYKPLTFFTPFNHGELKPVVYSDAFVFGAENRVSFSPALRRITLPLPVFVLGLSFSSCFLLEFSIIFFSCSSKALRLFSSTVLPFNY